MTSVEAQEQVLLPRFSRFLGTSAIFSAGLVVGKIAGLLLLPVVTRLLPPDRFGTLDVLSLLFSAMGAVMILGLDVASTRLYPVFKPEDRDVVFSSWLLINVVVAAALVTTFAILGDQISSLLFGEATYGREVFLTALIVSAGLLRNLALGVLRNITRAVSYAVLSGAGITANALLVVALLWRSPTVYSALLAQVIGTAVVALTGIALVRKHLRLKPSPDVCRQLLRLGMPLAPAAAFVSVADVVSRTILFRTSGPEQVGLLSLAVRLSSVVVVASIAIQTAWQPRAFEAASRGDATQLLSKDAKRILSLFVSLTAFGGLAAPTIVRVVSTPEYRAATSVTGWMFAAALGFAIFQVLAISPSIDKRLGRVTMATLGGALVSILATLLLAPDFDANGAGAGLAIGQWTAVVLLLLASRGGYRIMLPTGSTAILLCAGAAAVLAGTSSARSPLLILLAIGGLVLALAFDGTLGDVVRMARANRRRVK